MSAPDRCPGDDAERLFAASLLDLRALFPFMYASLSVIPRSECEKVDTLAVTSRQLLYDPAFVSGLKRPYLTFYLMHALCHILMRHHGRRSGREPGLWNLACDLYINKVIADLYGIEPGHSRMIGGTEVSIPADAVFDGNIDTHIETPETIYRRLYTESKERKEAPSERHDRPSVSGSQGISYSDDQSPGSGRGDEVTDGSAPAPDDGDDTPPQKSSKETIRSDDDSRDDPDDDRPGPGTSEAELKSEEADPSPSQTGQDRLLLSDGLPLDSKTAPDVCDMVDDRTFTGEDPIERGELDHLIARIETLSRRVRHLYGKGALGEAITPELPSYEIGRTDWRSLLRNRLTAIVTDERSLATPDRRFVHRRLYVEGPVVSEEELASVKICVDTSASMTDRDLGTVFREIGQILKEFRVSAELVFWDSAIEGRVPFDSHLTFTRALKKAAGRGGTDPSCLFEAFMPRNERGHTDSDPVLLLIFTDGWFIRPDPGYARRFGRDTFWILATSDAVDPERFDPGFGRIISLG